MQHYYLVPAIKFVTDSIIGASDSIVGGTYSIIENKTLTLINSAIFTHIECKYMIRLYASIIRQAVVDHFWLITFTERVKQEKLVAYSTPATGSYKFSALMKLLLHDNI